MGLDVYLYQFNGLNTEAILKLSRYSEELSFEAIDKRKAQPNSEIGQYPSERDWIESRKKLINRACELGLPESIVDKDPYGGELVSAFSKKYPEREVGEWHSFATARELMEYVTGKNIYFVFPEAKGDPELIRPNWAKSKQRLNDVLSQLHKLGPAEIEEFYERFVIGDIHPEFLKKIQRVFPAKSTDASDSLAGYLAQIEVMIETMDYVLNHERPQEFLLRWSA